MSACHVFHAYFFHYVFFFYNTGQLDESSVDVFKIGNLRDVDVKAFLATGFREYDIGVFSLDGAKVRVKFDFFIGRKGNVGGL